MNGDITKTNFCIKELINVIKGSIPPRTDLFKGGREKDGFIYILTGSCFYTFENGESFTATQGSVLYLANGARYKMRTGNSVYSFVYCDFVFLDDTQRKSAVYKIRNNAETNKTFESLYKSVNANGKNGYAESMALLYKIYAQIIETANVNYVRNSLKEKMEWSKNRVREKLNITVTELASELNISEVYFRKIFKSVYKISPSQYIISTRLERAKDLMGYPFLSLAECAEQSGFSSVQYFSRMFKKIYFISPAKFRKEYLL